MPSLTQHKTLPHLAKDMYDLVMDIEAYPAFLPWCKKAKITNILSETNLEADLLINFKHFLEKYRSSVTHSKNKDGHYTIEVIAIQGPFKKLINHWIFKQNPNGSCEITFFIDFEFNSFILNKMIGAMFGRATEKMMTAFEERAKSLLLE